MWGGGVNLVSSTPSGAESKEVVSADYVLAKAGGLPVGSIITMPFGVDESENKFRYLNGQTIIQSQFSAFTAKVKSWQSTRTNLFTSETNWQAEKTASVLGQCGKFVIDDDAGTIRLPCVVNINGLTDLANCGVVKSESLPNINGWLYAMESSGSWGFVSDSGVANFNKIGGAFQANDVGRYPKSVATGKDASSGKVSFNASRSSSTYQDNAPVQQEAVQYPYVICVNTGVEEADRPINNYQVNNVYSYGMSQYYKGTMNNNSWLKSNGQWNSGTVYTDVYNWALEQMNAGTSGFVASTAEYTDYDWVINTADQTFRLPLLNGQEGVFADAVKGNGLTIGLTNGTKNVGLTGTLDNSFKSYAGTVESYYGADVGTTSPASWWNSGTEFSLGLTTDPSKSGMIVDKTVPEGYYLYFYVGDTLQNASLIDIAKLGESVATKVNEVQAAAASMPSAKYINLTLGVSGTEYIAPANGYFFCVTQGNTSYLYIINQTLADAGAEHGECANLAGGYYRVTLPARKGDRIKIHYDGTPTFPSISFHYAEGET